MDKVNKTSMAVNDERLKQLMDLFPEAISEGKIDFDKLRQVLGEHIDTRPERYSFTWAGKRDAMQAAQIPSRATLIPDRKASVNFDETQNVFIEGDNLEVLKLLARPYFGRVKMIYIDPPYNTGNDFIYPDNYTDPLDTYLRMTGQKNGNGDYLTTNTDTNGRYHSSWLSMMYPRLLLARQLLRDDGVIFISIDDNEVHNLRMMLNEIFGESNFVAIFPWKKRTAKSDVPFGISQDFEWIVCYARGINFFAGIEHERSYHETEDFPNDRWRLSDLTTQRTPEERPNSAFDLVDPKTGNTYPLNPKRVWGVTRDSFPQYYARGKIVFPDDYPFLNITVPAFRVFESEDKAKALKKYGVEQAMKALSTDLPDEIGMTEDGNKEIQELFGEKPFSFPKPSRLIRHFISSATIDGDIVMDFFAGSGTTAQAVLELNQEDITNRRFVLIQLPEKTGRDDFPTIADIGRERIRRVIRKMQEDKNGKMEGFEQHPGEDLGFRAFRLAESNYRPDPDPEALSEEAYAEQLALWADSLLVDGWDATNVIYEVALKEGYGLNIRVEEVPVENNTVYHVTDPDKEQSFTICLDETLRTDIIDALGLTQNDLFICHDKALDDTFAMNLVLRVRLQTL